TYIKRGPLVQKSEHKTFPHSPPPPSHLLTLAGNGPRGNERPMNEIKGTRGCRGVKHFLCNGWEHYVLYRCL
ncbi:MAG: hypothetical protein ACK55Z_34025, partial [bacterium]